MEHSRYVTPTGLFNSSEMLWKIASRQSLYRAWRKVRANRGAAGIDAVSLQQFERKLEDNLAELRRNLLNKTYEPLPSRYISIPKANGKQRELAIPAVRDRVAQRAALDFIEPLFEPQFHDCSFAFRAGRSCEMAVQRIVVARAQGYRWTVESDINDFFPAIDHQLLLADLKKTVDDQDVLTLIKLWLDAGALDGSRPKADWVAKWRDSLAGIHLATRDALHGIVDDVLGERLGGGCNADDTLAEPAGLNGDDEFADEPRQNPSSGFARAAFRRLAYDGLLLALAHRGLLRSLTSAKALSIGGAAIGLAALTPVAIRKLRELSTRDIGALQGAPISPLLSNVYLHPFDETVIRRGFRPVRYCDDFVVLCRNEAEARAALGCVEAALRDRRLKLNPEKTRIVPPNESFDFLGYGFAADGSVTAPPNVPEVLSRRVMQFAANARSRARAIFD